MRHLVLAVPFASGAGGCADFDPTRQPPRRGSVGQEVFAILCDRVGAQALREDLTGASYRNVCHPDARGAYADAVDATKLPTIGPAADREGRPVSAARQHAARHHAVAKIEALGRRRAELVLAFDDLLKDSRIPAAGGDVSFQDELRAVLGRLGPVYDDGTIPHVTRAFGQVSQTIADDPEARNALARLDAHRGYRPRDATMGLAHAAFAYPGIAEATRNVFGALSAGDPDAGVPEGVAWSAGQAWFTVLRAELGAPHAPGHGPLTAAPDPRDAGLVRWSRPRTTLELARALLLHEEPAWSSGTPRWLVARDARGVARVAHDDRGTLVAPFVDEGGPDGASDGQADVDTLGQFVTSTGRPAPTPFPTSESDTTERDDLGRATVSGQLAFDYVDTDRTLLAALVRELGPMVAPSDPDRSSLLDVAAIVPVVAGDRAPATKRYDDVTEVRFSAYGERESPLLDLVHALGQILGDGTTDDTLAVLERLAREHPDVVARLVGAAMTVRSIGRAHPEASLPSSAVVWDELLAVLAKIAARPGLMEGLVRALGQKPTLDLPRSLGRYLTMRDRLTYDRANLNGAPWNRTLDRAETLVVPVDRGAPDVGDNQSAFQRFLQTIHDTNGMSICTKPGAVAHIVWKGVAMDYPSFTAQAACFVTGSPLPANPSPQCGLFRVENVAENLVDAIVGQVKLDIRDPCLRDIIASPLTGIVGGADAFLENISGIKGWNTRPSIQGINRMVFFDVGHDGIPGDTANLKTHDFLRDLFDPTPTLACAPAPFTDADGKKLNLRHCTSFKDTLRGRDADALFPIEELGFMDAAKPIAQAFKDADANLLFVEVFDILHAHWGSSTNDRLVRYEPVLAEVLASDLLPAIASAVSTLQTMKIPHCTREAPDSHACLEFQSRDGVRVLADALASLVDPARHPTLTARNGARRLPWNDGSRDAPVTPLALMADALRKVDVRLAEEPARAEAWTKARGELVDRFLSVDGTPAAPRFRSPVTAAAMPLALATLREQRAAHCPSASGPCAWAAEDLPRAARDVVTGPTFATSAELLDELRSDASVTTELQRLLAYLLTSPRAAPSTTEALVDLLQATGNPDAEALLRASRGVLAPEVRGPDGAVVSRGLVPAAVEALARVTRDPVVDPNRALVVLVGQLLRSPTDADGRARRAAPIGVLADAVADVNREKPEDGSKLTADDYGRIAREITTFCTDPERGLEQLYAIVRQATAP